ncbi:MAG: GHKL domain-containing protein [Bacteroidetes bacterium]|nr:GHKL domain-containing protein [Bacteroidota bacterium]
MRKYLLLFSCIIGMKGLHLHAQMFTPIVQEEFYPLALRVGDGQNQYSLSQDQLGFVFIGVNDGLVRFDGRQFHGVNFEDRDKGFVLSHTRHKASGQLFLRTAESFGQVQSLLGDSLVYRPLSRLGLHATVYLGRQGQLANNNYQVFAQDDYVYYQTDDALRRWLVSGAREERLAKLDAAHTPKGWYLLGGKLYVLIEDKGICRLNGGRLEPMPVFAGLAGEELFQVTPYNENYVLATTQSGKLYLLGKDKYHLLSPDATAQDALAGARISATIVTDTHIILCTQGRGCIFLSRDMNRPALDYVLRDHNGLPDNFIHTAHLDEDGRLWLAHTNTVSWVQLSWPVQFLQGLGPDVNAMYFDHGRLYIAKDNGLFRLGGTSSVDASILSQLQARQNKQQQLVSQSVGSRPPSVVQVEQNKVQDDIASLTLKMHDLRKKKTNAARQKQMEQYQRELANLEARARKLEEEKNLYQRVVHNQEEYTAAMQEMKAELRKRRTTVSSSFFAPVSGTEGLRCLDLAAVGGYLLCGTEQQILVFKGGKKETVLKYGANKLLASSRYPGRVYVVQNDRIGYITLADGKWSYHMNMDPGKGAVEMSTLPRGSKDAAITTLAEDERGNIWMGCENGVFFLNPDQGIGARQVPSSANINNPAIVYGQGKLILAFTQRNAYRLKGVRFQRSALLGQVADMTQPKLYLQAGQTLWSLKGNSLYRLNAKSDDLALQDSVLLPHYLRVRKHIIGDGNTLYFAANSGLARYNLAARIKTGPTHSGNVRLLWVRAHSRHAEDNGFQHLGEDEYHSFGYDPGFRLELGFAVPGYDFTDGALTYEYRLQGEGSWKPLQSNRLDLDFKPGVYEVEIRARDALGNWGTPAVYKFELAPPFYQRWQFLVILVIVGTLAIFLITRRIERYQRAKLVRRNAELEVKVDERTEELRAQQAAVLELNSELLQQKNELEIKNQQIEAQRETIAQQERKAALGEIAPSMAHEINSPLGAIQSAADNIRNTLPPALQQLPPFVGRLQPDQQQQFWEILQRLVRQEQNLTISQERQAIADLENWLVDRQIADARTAAQQIVKGGYQGEPDLLMPFLQGADSARELPRHVLQLGSLFKQLNLIQSSSRKAQRIIESLKDAVYQRPDASIPVPVNLHHNLETILTLYDYHLRQGITLTLDIPEGLPQVEAFPEELHQVWTNLLMNAIYAMKNQGSIHIRMERVADQVQVHFADSGPGIPQEIAARVFEPMFTTKPQGEGTGLGLSIVRKIIEDKHHGRIWVQSRPGETVFTVSLPIVQPTVTSVSSS